jgi:hypothetical protein
MRSIRLLPAIVCLAFAGCSSSLPPETDAARGREALKTVLDTWKRGGAPDELKNATPSITVRDPDWAAGYKLTDFEIAPEDGRAGVDLLLSVKLSLTLADGKTRDKKVGYIVGVGSTSVVMRNE